MRHSISYSGKEQQGLTLVELLVVISIIVLLATILLSVISGMKASSRKLACMANMRQVGLLILTYSTQNNGRLLPAALGKGAAMNDSLWYYLMDEAGLLAFNPNNPANAGGEMWAGRWDSIMACPERSEPPHSYISGGSHATHFSVNQYPGFYNRVNTSEGSWPTMIDIQNPHRTFLLAESTSAVAYLDGRNLAYPHPHKGKDLENGNGMNLIFYDGRAEYFRGKLPILSGTSYSKIPPEESFPWF